MDTEVCLAFGKTTNQIGIDPMASDNEKMTHYEIRKSIGMK
jgi:hypothetical protein